MSMDSLRRPVTAIASFAGVCAAIVAASPAAEAAATELHVSPTTVRAGQSVHVSGSCEPNTQGFVLSSAFLHDASHDFAGVGAVGFSTSATGGFAGQASIPATISPGTYTVTARCGGGNLGISLTLTVTAPDAGGVPTAVPAGSGGVAATSDHSEEQLLGLGGAGAVLVGIGVIALARQRGHRH
jgi:hypothetical protein